MSTISGWLEDNNNANRYTKTYFKDFVDVSGDIIIRNGSLETPLNTISFNDETGFVNFGNVYFGGQFYVYNPTTASNIDLVSYVNTNNDNVNYISGLTNNIGTMTYYAPSDFNIFNNIYCQGQIQYLESGTGNHVDLVGKVLTNINDIATNTTNIATNTSSISTLNTKLTEISWSSGTPNVTTVTNKLQTSVLSFGTTLNGVSPITFGYISTLSANAQTALDSKCSLSGNQTIAGIKSFSSPPVMSGASISTGSIPLTSISGTAVDLASYQIISGLKQFSTTPIITANLRLDGNLSLGGATVSITNATLQKNQYLSTVTSDVQTQLNAKICRIPTPPPQVPPIRLAPPMARNICTRRWHRTIRTPHRTF